ncbi:MAG: bifunctional 5,10-methylenetetrahydrofolate dehydrogenase/5,10-methenyltetrahydrofolate cyclohydrolase [Myxococcales bacterium]|nr:bifunctional 5,10-methylenetetrahydrofolate dehydrogenase/5,10-methenyltetrahydrofolate cyclohydrolase [Myxococcales bacterium]
MTATRLAGAGVAAKVLARVAGDAAALRARGVTPTLAVVLVGDDPASHVYVAKKTRTAAECGVGANDIRLPQDTSQAALLALITTLNNDPAVHGILVQLPLPAQIDSHAVIAAIAPSKDVDGLGPVSQGALLSGQRGFVPCTPKGCMALLAETGVPLVGKRAVVLGRSVLVGKPMSMLLTSADLTVTLCHSKTVDLPGEIARADILVAAIGRPEFVQGEWIKPGAIVIDVGVNRLPSKVLVGDVAFAAASARAAFITPVPGGVGPMTIACLMENTVQAATWLAA